MASPGWRWAPVPRRLLDEEWFLELDHEHRSVLLSLYLAADKNGVVPASPRALKRLLGIESTITPLLVHLQSTGCLLLYDHEDTAYLQLDRYKADRPANVAKRQCDSGWVEPGSTGSPPTVHKESTDGPPTVRLEERRSEEIRGEETTQRAAREEEVSGWRLEARDLFGDDNAPRVIRIVQRVAASRGLCFDVYMAWMEAVTILKLAATAEHFTFALDSFLDKLTAGDAKTFGRTPWSWIRTVANNGPMDRNHGQDMDYSHINTHERHFVGTVEREVDGVVHVFETYDDGSENDQGTPAEFEAFKASFDTEESFDFEVSPP